MKIAIVYSLNQREYLCAFLKHGEIEISNNQVENAIRPIVVGRKNWLFCDTQAGASASIVVFTLLETAKANGLNPETWLNHILSVLPDRLARNPDAAIDDMICAFTTRVYTGNVFQYYTFSRANLSLESSESLARILNVAPARLAQPPENPVDALIEYFLWLDETHDANFYGEMARLSDFLSQYWNKRSLLFSGEMSVEAFREWKLHWEQKNQTNH